MKKAVALLLVLAIVVGFVSTVSAAPKGGITTYIVKDPGGGVRP